MRHIQLWLSLAGMIIGLIVSVLTGGLEYLPVSITVIFMVMFAGLGFAIGMIIKGQIEKNENAKQQTRYESDVKTAEFYIKCYKSGYSKFEGSVAKEKMRLFAQDLSYFQRGSDEDIRNAFNESKALAESIGKEFFLHVQQSVSKKKPDEWEILRAKRPIDNNISDKTLLALYDIGEKCAISVDIIRKEEEEERLILDAFIEMTGRQKRISMLNRDAFELAQKVQSYSRLPRDFGQQKEADWAIIGGVASAIGGAGAGIAAAIDTQIKNAEIRAHNAQMAQIGFALDIMSKEIHEKNKQRLEALRDEIEQTRSKQIEEMDADELMSMLSVRCKSISVTETGTARISAEIILNTKDKIYLREGKVRATIDGVICANLIEDGIRRGRAYLTLPRSGISAPGSKIELTGICTTVRNANAQYQVEFEPYHLWLMEL